MNADAINTAKCLSEMNRSGELGRYHKLFGLMLLAQARGTLWTALQAEIGAMVYDSQRALSD